MTARAAGRAACEVIAGQAQIIDGGKPDDHAHVDRIPLQIPAAIAGLTDRKNAAAALNYEGIH